jgi:hypothetical protein
VTERRGWCSPRTEQMQTASARQPANHDLPACSSVVNVMRRPEDASGRITGLVRSRNHKLMDLLSPRESDSAVAGLRDCIPRTSFSGFGQKNAAALTQP